MVKFFRIAVMKLNRENARCNDENSVKIIKNLLLTISYLHNQALLTFVEVSLNDLLGAVCLDLLPPDDGGNVVVDAHQGCQRQSRVRDAT